MLHDLRIALRSLAKTPGFAAVVILTLVIGLGATTTVFCWRQNMISNPVPGAADQGSLRVLVTKHGDTIWHTASLPDLRDAAQATQVFSGIIGSQITPACLYLDGQPGWLYGQITTANFFDVLGVRASMGRTFRPDEDRHPGGDNVLVLSERCWRRRFAADPGIVGRSVEINRHPFTVIGIVPAAFQGTMSGLACDFWAPVSMHHEVANFGSLDQRSDRWLHTQVRLAPGIDDAIARTALDAISARLTAAYPGTNESITLRVLPFARAPYGVQPVLLPVLKILLVVCFGVLLICAANIANLLLARATARQREMGIRLAIGASRARVIRLLCAECAWLLLGGTAGGLLVSNWAVSLLVGLTPNSPLPINIRNDFSLPIFVFATLAALTSGAVAGLLPAWQATRININRVLKDGSRGTSAAGPHVLRRVLVVTEIALALVLLIGAGLCVRSVQKARHADLGVDPANVVLAGLRVGMHGYDDRTGPVFYRKLQQEIAAQPGVVDVALGNVFPLGLAHGSQATVQPEGYVPRRGEDTTFPYAIISPHYFSTLGTRLLSGRDFTEQDAADTLPAVIVNEAFARRFWPETDPLGRKLRVRGCERTVVGVVRTVTQYELNEKPQPFFYLPYQQGAGDLDLGLCVRTRTDPHGFLPALRQAIHRLDPAVEIWSTTTMGDHMQGAFMAQTFAMKLLFALGAVALVLAGLGVYAVIAYSVNQRRNEFGVRMALGAAPGDVERLVLRQGLGLAVIGTAAGLVLAFSGSHLLAGLLYRVSPFDPLTFTVIPLLLAAVAVAASWIPARRATRVDPNEALRSE